MKTFFQLNICSNDFKVLKDCILAKFRKIHLISTYVEEKDES